MCLVAVCLEAIVRNCVSAVVFQITPYSYKCELHYRFFRRAELQT
jgi:hypothetical protein